MRIPHLRRWKQFPTDLWREIQNDHVLDGAAVLAFFFLLAVFPAAIFALSLQPYLSIPHLQEALLDLLHQVLPAQSANLFDRTVRYAASDSTEGLLTFGLLFAVWSGSAGVAALMDQLNIIHNITQRRPFWKSRTIAILLMLLFSVLAIGSLSLVIFGGVVQSWLASLIGWIDPPEGMTGQQAAVAAEDRLQRPPAGPATDPLWDNEVLTHLIAACDRAGATGDPHAQQRARAAMERELATQLRPNWDLMWQAIGLLRGLLPGGHVPARWDADKDAFTWYAEHLREDGAPQPRRDSAVSAARRLARLERLQASHAVQRAFDDPAVMAEHRLAGEAFAGQVTAAERDRIDASGRRRALRPRPDLLRSCRPTPERPFPRPFRTG